jgi:hypothetical protein
MKQTLQNIAYTKVLGAVRAAGFDLNSEMDIVDKLLGDSYYNNSKCAGILILARGGDTVGFFDYLKDDVEWME